MYRALESFTTKDYDVRRKQILDNNFTSPDKILEFLNIGYIEEYDGTIEITENGTYDVSDYETADVEVGGGDDFYITDASTLFYNNARLDILNELLKKCKNLTATKLMFYNCFELTEIPLFDTSTVTDMEGMFQSCRELTIIPQFNTSNATNTTNMFNNCAKITTIPQLDTRNATNISSMFNNCRYLSNNPISNTDKVTNMVSVFSGCSSIQTLDLRNFNTENVVYMNSMFNSCSSLVDLNVDSFDLKNVTSMDYIFGSCPKLSNDSLNSILKMCSTAVKLSANKKTLKSIYLTQAQATICTTLSNWELAENSGWTTGY